MLKKGMAGARSVKNIIKGMVFFLIMMCCMGGGYLLGGRQAIDTRATNNEFQVSQSQASRQGTERYDTDLVAIVNLDEGSKGTSYSQALLSTLDIRYEVIGLEAAKRGIQTGRYSSYLVIPGTFSTTVETINATPQKAILEYEISTNLTDEAKEKAIYNIGDVYTKLNHGLSEIYIASILGEVHDVQDSSGIVLSNDQSDLEALAGVQGNDLIATIEIPEMEVVDNNIQMLDLRAAYAKNDEILSSIDGVYESAVINGAIDYDKIKEQVMVAEQSKNSAGEVLKFLNANSQYDDTDLTNIENSLYAENTNELKSRINTVETAVEAAKNGQMDIAAYIEKLEAVENTYGNVKEQLTGMSKGGEQDGKFPDKGYEAKVTEYTYYNTSQVDAYIASEEAKKAQYANDKLMNYYEQIQGHRDYTIEVLQNWFASLKSQTPGLADVQEPDWRNMVAENEVPTLDTVDAGTDAQIPNICTLTLYDMEIGERPEELVSKIPSLNKSVNGDEQEGEKSAEELLNEIVNTAEGGRDERVAKFTTIKDCLQDFNETYRAQGESQSTLSKSVNNFDFASYIDQDTIDSLKQTLSANEVEIEGKIADQDQAYNEYVSRVYEASSENTLRQQKSVQEGQKASQEKLETNLANAKNTKYNSSEENKKLIGNIQGILPYTSIGTQENQLAYRFIVNPIAIDTLAVEGNQENKQENTQNKGAAVNTDEIEKIEKRNSYTVPVLIGAGVILVVIALGVLIGIEKKKKGRGDRL